MINDLDEFDTSPVVDSVSSVNSVAENASIGTTVGITALASDSDATNNTISYSLTDNDGGRFAINATTGVVTVAGGIDREVDGATRTIRVRATSADNSFSEEDFVINIVDVDEFNVTTPTDTDSSLNNIDENVALGTAVGITANAFDLDATTNTITYSLTSNVDGLFQINPGTGVVTTATAINRELVGATRSITVQATSSDGSTATQTFNIAINDLDEFDVSVVSDANATFNAVNENATTGTVVGLTAFALDADATNNVVSYSLTDNAGGRFAIDATTGVVTVADGSGLNYEANTSHQIAVRATSADGSVRDQVFAISVLDLDEFDVSPVVDASSAVNGVNENSAIGTVVGITAQAFDADGTTNSVTYTLTNNDGGRFAINPVTGEVTVAGAINREADGSSRTVTVRATSADGSISEETYLINIYDVDEFDSVYLYDADSSINRVNENSAIGTEIGYRAFGRDADATNNLITYSLDNDANGSFAIDSTTGLVKTAKSLNFEATPSLSIIVRATSSDGSFALKAETIQVSNVFEAPVGTRDSYSTSYIDKLVVLNAGVLSNDIDPDGDFLIAELVTGPGSGQVVFLSNGLFAYTPVPGFIGTVNIVYRAFDGLLYSEPITISINVLIPDNLPGDNGGGSRNTGNSSGNAGDGSSSSGGSTAPAPITIGALDQPIQAANQVPQEVAIVSGTVGEATATTEMAVAFAEEKKQLAIAAILELSSRSYSQSHVGYDLLRRRGEEHHSANHKALEDNLIDYASASKKESEESIETKSSSFESMVFSTVVGTGMLLWVVQGAQLAATLISVAPAWMQLDPLSILNANEGKSKKEELSAGEKLFD